MLLNLAATDENEPPEFLGEPSPRIKVMETHCAEPIYYVDGAERKPSANGEPVGSVTIYDPDVNQNVNMEIVNSVPFVIGGTKDQNCVISGQSTTCTEYFFNLSGELDFEAGPKTHTLQLKMTDGSKSDTRDFVVEVLDCNEQPSVGFDEVSRQVFENAAGGLVTGDGINATDPDNEDNNKGDANYQGFVYNIVGGAVDMVS